MATATWDLQSGRSPRPPGRRTSGSTSPRTARPGGEQPVEGLRARDSARRAPARVYRVRRALVLLATVILAASPVAASRLQPTGAAAPAEVPAARAAQAAPAATRVVVDRGDTIWELARARRPAGTDLASYVREVVAVNEVDPTALAPGSVLWFPGP